MTRAGDIHGGIGHVASGGGTTENDAGPSRLANRDIGRASDIDGAAGGIRSGGRGIGRDGDAAVSNGDIATEQIERASHRAGAAGDPAIADGDTEDIQHALVETEDAGG